MDAKIIEMAKTFPNLTVSIGLSDLIEGIEFSVSHTRSSLEQMIQDEAQEKYLSIEGAAKLLDVDRSSIYRWTKAGILKPVVLGGKRRFRLSDINKLLEA